MYIDLRRNIHARQLARWASCGYKLIIAAHGRRHACPHTYCLICPQRSKHWLFCLPKYWHVQWSCLNWWQGRPFEHRQHITFRPSTPQGEGLLHILIHLCTVCILNANSFIRILSQYTIVIAIAIVIRTALTRQHHQYHCHYPYH